MATNKEQARKDITKTDAICPGGCLVFFPSYKLMDKLRNRWSQTGQWKRLNAQKPVCVEPRGAQEEFENVLKDYYDTIRQGNKPTTTGRRRGKKVDASATTSKGNINKVAKFLAVRRGKYDIKVSEKTKYNDTKNLLKAFLVAMNGTVSKLFEHLIKQQSKASSVHPVDVKPIDVEESKSWFTETKNPKVTKINPKGSNGVAATKINKCSVPTKKYDCSLLKTESKGSEERSANKSEQNTGAAYIDLETENRCSSPPSMNISHGDDDFELTVVEETPNYSEPLTVKKDSINEAYSTTVESISEVDFTHSTIIQTKFPHQQLPNSFTSLCSTSASAFTTPKKQHISYNTSPLYSSVNSHVHKRRKSSASVTVKMEQYDSPDPETPKEIKKFSVPQSCILDVP
ncbi:ATP-dependent helicase, C-terminal [Artemisia annua]|uniref:ATP-dependent helicase, C-terminal n=1 Tax=Artemisia annua TaxID=35608 RepID=A0A2U1MXN3_ARTAN|nr:ATP-dependent helicase, C-terminal [Artemisia annua]